MADIDRESPPEVLDSKRDATRYQVLVEIAARQPAVSQTEIAEAIGVTSQAVSDYVRDLVEQGYVDKRGRGRYQVTKEGVDWLISRTDELRRFTDYVAEEVIEEVDVEAAVAADPIDAGDTVALSMREGVLHAAPGEGPATAVAVGDANSGEAVGVTDFEGLLDYEPGAVTVLSIPPVAERAGRIDPAAIGERLEGLDRLAVAGTEAYALARAAGREPDIQFGTPDAVQEAAGRGLDVVLVAVEPAVSTHADQLREANLDYEVVDLGEGAGAR